MALETITREEFDRRLDAANARRTQELQQIEDQQKKTEQLLSQFEQTLSEIEAEMDRVEQKSSTYPALLRKRLMELAVRAASAAASL